MALFAVVLVACFVSTALACNGYELRNFNIEVCNENRLISFENISPELKDDCTVVVKGCINVLKQVDWGNGTYKVEKKTTMGMPIKFSGKEDLCKLLNDSKKNPDVTMIFKMLKLEQKCPLKAGKICGNPKGVSVEKYKGHMKMLAGDFEGRVEGTSSGGPGCIKFSGSIVSKGGAGAAGGISRPSMPKMG